MLFVNSIQSGKANRKRTFCEQISHAFSRSSVEKQRVKYTKHAILIMRKSYKIIQNLICMLEIMVDIVIKLK